MSSQPPLRYTPSRIHLDRGAELQMLMNSDPRTPHGRSLSLVSFFDMDSRPRYFSAIRIRWTPDIFGIFAISKKKCPFLWKNRLWSVFSLSRSIQPWKPIDIAVVFTTLTTSLGNGSLSCRRKKKKRDISFLCLAASWILGIQSPTSVE